MDAVLTYLKNNPVMATVLGGLLIFLIILLCVFLALKKKAKNAEQALKNANNAGDERSTSKTDAAEEERLPSPPIKPIVGLKENVPEKERKQADEPKAPKALKQAKQTTKTQTPQTVKTEVPEKGVATKATKEKAAQTEKTKPIQPTKAEKKTEKTEKEKTGGKTERSASDIKKRKKREKTMLLDELKDVDTDLDFYEEDETDRVARYSGKWVICRIITNDKTTDEEETFFFELHASNGEKLLSSEEYTTYNGALRGIETHKANILRGNLKITLSKKGDYIFKLLSGKNLLLCMGENYPTRAACESAIESAKRFAKTAIVDENIQDVIVKVPIEDDSAPLPLPDGYNGKWIIDSAEGVDGEPVYFFELFANNGEKLLSSEEYTTYIGAVNGIQTHKSNIAAGNFRVSLTKRGDYIYKLLNRNGQLLCLGEHYKTKRRCLNAVESVKRFAKNSPVLTDPKLIAPESEKAPEDL